ncbi:DnaB-like helicase N-terminal domain-containing protein [Aeoliella mucimassa]|uniref:Replicative DNA helicase n=1 Tax=Aeoliella mucimassa TaxID=2527972 RepID=A0A518AM40_9BACT|nr:DnaB-like helicase N-terminal domain-containing protein [Aeoliella mucimassa]QDU55786.1 Replicative DNA helicase [Aeoliella mucimassa]
MISVSEQPAHAIPLATDATECVLGSMLLDARCIPKVLRVLSAHCIVEPEHAELFRAIERRHRMGQPIDPVLLLRDLQDSEFRHGLGAFMASIAEKVPTTAHAEHYALIVAEAARKRNIYDAASVARQHALNGKSSREILCELHAFADDALREADPAVSELESFPLSEFLKIESKQDFLIDRCITAGQGGVQSARSKSLKTTLAIAEVFALATGTPFMGEYEVKRECSTGIITAESGISTAQETFRRIAKASDATNLEELRNFNLQVSTKIPHLVDQAGRDQLERFIDRFSLECLFVDPTYKAFAGVDDFKLSRMAEVLFPISEIIDRTGCSIVFVHHHRKTPQREGEHYTEPTMEDIGGTGWQQWARFFIMLNRRREWNPETGQHWLWFKTEGSAGFGTRRWLDVCEGRRDDPGGRTWQVELRDPAEGEQAEREEAAARTESLQMESDRRKVCEALAPHPEGLTKSKTQELSKVSRRRWQAVLETMLDLGELELCEVAISNQKTPREGIRLVIDSMDTEAP